MGGDVPFVYCVEISNSHGPPVETPQLTKEKEWEREKERDRDTETGEMDPDHIVYTPDVYTQVGGCIGETLADIYGV
ncbi:hypothetical protein KIPB_004430 [Kipferlia bialata]|uniref:Uncharacterized protein n=1 Tax=Kipferlia bialata TaxID=797122 RepID=A0A9K3CW02_9EUKA|nr:hypothetical protein KIPB_004430 [Kipferlia bialata]|eukprot:g4430.t1